LWKRLFFGAISFFIIFSYFFSIYFPKEERRRPVIDKIVIITETLFFFLSVFTPLIVKDIELQEWGTNIVFGPGGDVRFVIMVLFTFLIVGEIFRKYFKLSRKEKLRTQYFLIGAFIFAILNVVFNMIFPAWGNTYKYHYFGDYSAIFFLAFIAYAIVKRELFGIKVILTQLLVGVIAILLLVNVVGSESLIDYLWKGALFLGFLIFGYLLIRSVIREIERRQRIEEMSEELRAAYQELKKLDIAKSEFISIASHQLRTPLTIIKGYVHMILEGTYGKLPKKAEGSLEKVFDSNERLIKLVNDLLTVSKIEAGKLEVSFEKAKMGELISGLIEEFQLKAKEKHLHLRWEKPKKSLPKVLMDKDKMRQVLLNVLDNAIRYTHKGGVTIKCKVEDKKFRVMVKDTGEGLTKRETSKLFSSFSRGTAGTRFWTEGAGLGLYVARKFVELHKGKLWAESPGKSKGSTFYVELPLK